MKTEHGEFAQTLERGEFHLERLRGVGGERQFFAHLERRTMVIRADDEKAFAHGLAPILEASAG